MNVAVSLREASRALHKMNRVNRELNLLALVKDDERFIFLFDDCLESRTALCQTLGQFAADQDLSFTWYDAAKLSHSAREL